MQCVCMTFPAIKGAAQRPTTQSISGRDNHAIGCSKPYAVEPLAIPSYSMLPDSINVPPQPWSTAPWGAGAGQSSTGQRGACGMHDRIPHAREDEREPGKHSAHLLSLVVLLRQEVVVAQTHLAVASSVGVRICDGLHELEERRRRLDKLSERDRLLPSAGRSHRTYRSHRYATQFNEWKAVENQAPFRPAPEYSRDTPVHAAMQCSHGRRVGRLMHSDARQRTIAVLGGGISGIVSALVLSRKLPMHNIVLIEGDKRLGGYIGSHRVCVGKDTPLFENGPRSIRPVGYKGMKTLELVSQL